MVQVEPSCHSKYVRSRGIEALEVNIGLRGESYDWTTTLKAVYILCH